MLNAKRTCSFKASLKRLLFYVFCWSFFQKSLFYLFSLKAFFYWRFFLSMKTVVFRVPKTLSLWSKRKASFIYFPKVLFIQFLLFPVCINVASHKAFFKIIYLIAFQRIMQLSFIIYISHIYHLLPKNHLRLNHFFLK